MKSVSSVAGTFRKASSGPMKQNPAFITPIDAGYVRADTRLKEENRNRLHGRLARYTNDQLVAEHRRRGAHIMYGSDFDCVTTI